ncbi:kelch domain-containing protein 2-like isoform X2 [Ischnura elegans]|uniref:kelch domain-containing protein 2-like isoform X2 n=1 Tax=Ischnura elegans TaxID=197161 RepID=UPI001ED8A7B0|nr:kelch domain-containing protein 2-like isoform X2 [Ischnura elegans]
MSSQTYVPFFTMHDKIHHRSGHITFLYKEYMLVWGGYMENAVERSRIREICVYHNTNELWAYDINTEIWSLILTKGDTPPRNSGACGVLHDDFLYVFGGYHGVSDNFVMEGNSNQLLRLDLTTMTWKQLFPKGVAPSPCDKLVGWEYQGRLYFFGGFGPAPDIWSSGTFDFVPDHSLMETHPQRGWNNQLVSIDVRNCREFLSKGREKELLWEWPKTSGAMPSPRAAHAADICGSKLYLFGGRLKYNRMNDLHCLDMETMHWSGDLKKCHQANPEGRSWHSLTFVEDGKAVLYGGFNQHNIILKDCWVLEVPSVNWIKLCDGRPRLWHRASFLNTGDLIIMGGHKHSITDPGKDHAEELFVLNFTPKSLLRLCLDEILKHQKQLSQNWCWLPETLQAMLRLRVEQCSLR